MIVNPIKKENRDCVRGSIWCIVQNTHTSKYSKQTMVHHSKLFRLMEYIGTLEITTSNNFYHAHVDQNMITHH